MAKVRSEAFDSEDLGSEESSCSCGDHEKEQDSCFSEEYYSSTSSHSTEFSTPVLSCDTVDLSADSSIPPSKGNLLAFDFKTRLSLETPKNSMEMENRRTLVVASNGSSSNCSLDENRNQTEALLQPVKNRKGGFFLLNRFFLF